MIFASKIKELRKHFSLSQEKFAEKVGVSRSVLSQIEIAKIRPSVELISEICKVFDVYPEYFFPVEKGIDSLEERSDELIHNDSCLNCDKLWVINEAQKDIIEGLENTIKSQHEMIEVLEQKPVNGSKARKTIF